MCNRLLVTLSKKMSRESYGVPFPWRLQAIAWKGYVAAATSAIREIPGKRRPDATPEVFHGRSFRYDSSPLRQSSQFLFHYPSRFQADGAVWISRQRRRKIAPGKSDGNRGAPEEITAVPSKRFAQLRTSSSEGCGCTVGQSSSNNFVNLLRYAVC